MTKKSRTKIKLMLYVGDYKDMLVDAFIDSGTPFC